MDYFGLARHRFCTFPVIHLTINNVREFLGPPNKIMMNWHGEASQATNAVYIGAKSSVRPDKSDSRNSL